MTNSSKRFKIYRTSAGSGKTFSLASSYIELLFESHSDEYFEHIAALTFTNKATLEMKNRIIQYLYEIALNKNLSKEAQLVLEKIKEIPSVDKSQIPARCQKILSKIVHGYSKFTISTIDSFFSKIVRIFRKDLNLPYGYQIQIDKEQLKQYLNFAFYELLDSSVFKNFLNEIVYNLIIRQMEEENHWDIGGILNRAIDFVLHENDIIFSANDKNDINEDILKKLNHIQKKLLNCYKKFFERSLYNTAEEFLTTAASKNLKAEDFFGGNKHGLLAIFQKIAQSFENSHGVTSLEKLEPKKTMFQYLTDDTKWKKIPADTRNLLKIILENYLKTYFVYIFCNLFIKQLSTIIFLKHFKFLLNRYQEQNRQVVISEIGKLLTSIILDESVPYIYERYGIQFKNFFIDEFQDTSILQWMNMLPLIHEALSNGNSVMILGDAKQAIYRFRNSEVEQFIYLPKLTTSIFDLARTNEYQNKLSQEKSDLLSENPEEYKNTNYRSLPNIVKFNNAHFVWSSSKLDNDKNKILEKAYKNLEQDFVDNNSDTGLVCLYPIKELKNEEVTDHNGKSAENLSHYTLQLVYEIIKELVETKKNCQYSDIAVLIRSRSNCKKTAQFLTQKGLPVISVDSLTLDFSVDVRFLVNMLRLFDDLENNIAFSAILSYFNQKYLRDQKLHELLESSFLKIESPKDRLNYLEHLISQFFQTNFRFVDHFNEPIDQLLIYLMEITRFHEDKNDEKIDVYVMTFFQRSMEYLKSKRNTSLTEFLFWWDTVGKELFIVMPEGYNAVQIMTIHKAKGLQFPVVIYPFANFELSASATEIWIRWEEFPKLVRKTFNNLFQDKIHSIPIGSGFAKILESYFELADKINIKDYADVNIINQKILDEQNKQILDALNIHYVAMTRAKSQLHVIFNYREKCDNKDKFTNVGQLIWQFINNDENSNKLNFTVKEKFNSQIIYQFGEESKTNNEILSKNLANNVIKGHTYKNRFKEVLKETSQKLENFENTRLFQLITSE